MIVDEEMTGLRHRVLQYKARHTWQIVGWGYDFIRSSTAREKNSLLVPNRENSYVFYVVLQMLKLKK
jgi:hypothetical protein